jgi:hypothetical protein
MTTDRTRLATTIVLLYLGTCAGIIAWFATHKIQPHVLERVGGTWVLPPDAWNTSSLVIALVVATALALVAWGLALTWTTAP